MKSWRVLWAVVLMVVLQGVLPVLAQDSDGGNLDRYEKMRKLRREELDVSFEFFGKVVDFAGQPVADAEVIMRVRYVPLLVFLGREVKIVTATTDKEGRFIIKEDGYLLSLDRVEKEGYKFRWEYNRGSQNFSFRKSRRDVEHGQSTEDPVIFRVRKQASPDFVLSRGLAFGLRSGKKTMLDLIQMEWVEPERVFTQKMMAPDWHPDLVLGVEGEAGNLRLVVEAPDPQSGFVVEHHEFFDEMNAAPEHGYRPRVELPTKGAVSSVFLYMKAQGGLFYSKLSFDWREVKPGLLEVDAVYHTNLTGARGLEYTPSLESQYDWDLNIAHTRKEIRRADLLSGKPIAVPQVKP